MAHILEVGESVLEHYEQLCKVDLPIMYILLCDSGMVVIIIF